MDPDAKAAGAPATADRPVITMKNREDGLSATLMQAILLIPATVGIYLFWLRADVRRKVWNRIEIQGSHLEYTGKPMELLIGFIVAGVLLAGSIFLLDNLIAFIVPDIGLAAILQALAIYAILTWLGPIGLYRSNRYLMRRTSWRGIRAHMGGTTGDFIRTVLMPQILTVISLGLLLPRLLVATERYTIGNSSLGDARFSYHGDAGEIFRTWFICWLLLIPTFGLSLIWFRGWMQVYDLNHTRLAGMRLSANADPWRLFWLRIGRTLLIGLVISFVSTLIGNMLFTEIVWLVGDNFILLIATQFGFTLALLAAYYVSYTRYIEIPVLEILVNSIAFGPGFDFSTLTQAHERETGPGDGLDAVLGLDGI